MTNNDILRRIRYSFDFNDAKMIALFALADHEVSRAQVSNWLKKDDDPEYQSCSDTELATFLNGLIIDGRGKREGPAHPPESRLSNNMVLRKLKIALDLSNEEVLAILRMANMSLSNHELSALFRRVGHKNYRECKDQVLRNFLTGVQLKYRTRKHSG